MSVGAITGSTGSTASTGSNAFADMSSTDFIKIIIQELQQQDPLDPQDTSKLMEQISSLRNIESQTSLQDQLKALVTQNQIAAAGNLIGKLVAGVDQTNTNTSGLVTAVRVTSDGVLLQLDNGSEMLMDNVSGISNMDALSGATSGQ